MKYFLLAKSGFDNQIVALNKQEVYILPQLDMPYYASNGLYEQSLIDWCIQFCSKDKIFIDIGAQAGTYSISLAKHWKEVHSFEPLRMTYYALCGSIALSHIENIYCYPYALGTHSQRGEQIVSVVRFGGSVPNGVEKETVEVIALDSFKLKNVGLIKLDSQGLQVLKGAINTLRWSYPPILFESSTEELVTFLHGLGYSIHKINGYPNMFIATPNQIPQESPITPP